MHEIDIKHYELWDYRDQIVAAARTCWRGQVTKEVQASYLGGLPRVDAGFDWPKNHGRPLQFAAQISCPQSGLTTERSGFLLFFCDGYHWGYSANDKGHAVVLYQQGEQVFTADKLPQGEVTSLFGLWKRKAKPRVHPQLFLAMHESRSYPPWERKLISFQDEIEAEAYHEFSEGFEEAVQVGGYPAAIKADAMEAECARLTQFGTADDWQLLLQVNSTDQITWGDAGSLYWFILKDDLAAWRFDRVWMIMQSG